MTLPRLYEFCRYWRRHPPLGDLLAALVGYQAPVAGADPGVRPEASGAPLPGKYGSLEELIAEFTAADGKIGER